MSKTQPKRAFLVRRASPRAPQPFFVTCGRTTRNRARNDSRIPMKTGKVVSLMGSS